MSERLDRRTLLARAAAAAVAGWIPRSARNQPRLSESPFALGVASGSPLPDSVVLWTRLVGDDLGAQPVTVRWELAQDEGFARVVRSGQAEAAPELAHSVHVEPHGLAPGRDYFYRFLTGPWSSTVGRTRTLPAPDALLQRLRLAYASCQRWEHGWFAAYRHLRADAPDFVLFLGDYIYEYARARRQVRATDGQVTVSLAQYRGRHALHKSDPDLQAMHAACPWLFTWDDHEVQNDYAGAEPGDGLPTADFAARRAAAYQAYYEHMPLRASTFARAAQGAQLRLHEQLRFGRLASLSLLDNRQHRSAQACSPSGRGSATLDPTGCPAWDDPARTMLGAAQEAWLAARLAAGGAQWTLLAQSTLFGQRDMQPGPARTLWNDGWDGYPAARQRLLAALRQHRPANPVFLGGDVHENWIGHVKADYERPDSATLGVEFCGTSITSRSAFADRLPRILADNPHFVHADGDHRGYGLADFTPGHLQVSLRALDDVERRDSGIATSARFVVEAGRPLVERL